ncbi:malonate decarboxylase acyl carrier protein [Saezia sanguinis]|jgi:malonate decarboxylase delta subunit|uniref:malonate decarboxylase acyl carrier protein n=1 Tax=Saezia sanguinis TaxID=1965230 RepID=UPI00306DCE2E
MATKSLNTLSFEFKSSAPKSVVSRSLHYGVVGSGDMEVLIHQQPLDGVTKFKVVTPVTGFDKVWEKVLQRFVEETGASNAFFEINDNNSTPAVVNLRLHQALGEMKTAGHE